MIRIDPQTVYERTEIAQAFPTMSRTALTRCLLSWGGRRPYSGSRKVFIRGDVILRALAPTQTDEPPPPVDSGIVDSSPRPHGPQSTYVRRMTIR